MLKLYGESKSEKEIIKFCRDYISSIINAPHDRYHDILSLIPKSSGNQRALDYGCGWGHFSQAMFLQKNYNVTGIDYSENEIRICHLLYDKNEKIKYLNNSITEFGDSDFELVLSNQVIEHVHNPGMYLSEINRILKMHGHLVIALPNNANLNQFFANIRPNYTQRLKKLSQNTLVNYNKTHDHIHSWDPIHFVRFLSSVGFELEEFIPMEGISLPYPFKRKIFLKIPLLKNLSYTMAFRFKKVKNVRISVSD